MEAFLDTLWEYLAAGFQFLGESLFATLQNLHFLGPVVLISLLALCTICVTKILSKFIITKRYLELEKDFNYWVGIREEAMSCEDKEKGKRMARNIDQSTLNRAYYDYFFEGLLLGIVRKVIPIFFMFAFINEFYRSEKLGLLFGQDYVLQMISTDGEPILIGAVFWYIISVLVGYLLWFFIERIYKSSTKESTSSLVHPTEEITATNS